MDLDGMPVKESLSGEQIEFLHKIQHEYRHVGKLRKIPGHTLFSFNRTTKEIKPAGFERVCMMGMDGKPVFKVKCVIEPDCFYEQALNRKNFEKRLKRYGLL